MLLKQANSTISSKFNLLVVLLLTTSIIACTNRSEPPSLTRDDDKTTTLKVWWDKGFTLEEDRALEQLVSAWERKTNADIQLSFYGTDELAQKVERGLNSGRLPDAIAMFKSEKSLNARLAWEGKLADVSDVIAPVEDLYSQDVLKTVNFYNQVDRKRSYYAVPIHQATIHVYYWRDLLAKTERSARDIPTDWNDFWEFWKQVQDDLQAQPNQHIYGLGLPLSIEAGDTYQTFEQILAAYDVPILDAQGQLNVDDPQVRQGIIEVLDWYAQAYRQGYLSPDALHWFNAGNNRDLLNRKVLMTTNDTLSIAAALRQDQETYCHRLGISELPNKPSGEPLPHIITVQQVILLAQSKNQNLAKDFLAYLIKPKINGKFLKEAGGRHSPVLKPVWKDPFWKDKNDPHVSTATETLTHRPIRVFYTFENPAYSIVLKENIWGKVLERVLVEGITSEQAADEAIAQIKEIFADWYQ